MNVIAILATMVALGSPTAYSADYIQPQVQYAAAINDNSNHQYYVLVTIANGRSGVAKTGCVDANFLLGAIHREEKLGYDPPSIERVRQIALSNASHSFVFRSATALKNVGFERFGIENEDVCRVVRAGHLAYRPHNNFSSVAVDDRPSGPNP